MQWYTWVFSGVGILGLSILAWFFRRYILPAPPPVSSRDSVRAAVTVGDSSPVAVGQNVSQRINSHDFHLAPPPQPTAPITVSGTLFERVFVVRVGGYQDFTWSSKIRIEVKAIKRATPPGRSVLGGEQDHARIHISTSGGLVYGGEETTREGVNEFLVPVKSSEEETRSVLFFHAADNYFRFFRVFVDHINATTGEVTLDACFVRLFNEPPKASV